MWKILNSKFALLILGFALTTVLGTYLSDRFQRDAYKDQLALEERKQFLQWKREKKFEMFRQRLQEGSRSLEEVSDLINTRVIHLENAISYILLNDRNAMEKYWRESLGTSKIWNVKLNRFQNRLKRVVSEEAASGLNSYSTDPYPELPLSEFEKLGPNGRFILTPTDVHAHFWIVHRLTWEAVTCIRNSSCELSSASKKALQKRMIDLNYFTDDYVDTISNSLLAKTAGLEEFDDFRE